MSLTKSSTQCTFEDFTKDRSSTTTQTTESQSYADSSNCKATSNEGDSPFRMELFVPTVEKMEVSQKVHQRAVSWMITICWSKNLSQQCLWTTLLLYYCYRSKMPMAKQQLQLTLLTCLSLSLKMSTVKLYSSKQLVGLSSRPITPSDLVQKEAVILNLIDFNLVIPHLLEQLHQEEFYNEEQLEKIILFCELLMIKDCQIFFNRQKLENLLQVLGDKFKNEKEEENWNDQMHNINEDIRSLLKMKECQIVLKKYSSRLQLQPLLALFN